MGTGLSKREKQCMKLIIDAVNQERVPKGMSKVLDHLYLGNIGDASNIERLRDEGITHVLSTVHNCDGQMLTGSEFYNTAPDFHIEYHGFTSEDEKHYLILKHFEESFEFIERAREDGGKCLIHCMAGINRSGALTVAYVMVHLNIGPVSATRIVYASRGVLLFNQGFIKQLVKFSSKRKLMEKDKDEIDSQPSRIT